MQGLDIDKAIHWLSVATNNNLMRLAAKAERFLVQAAMPLSGSKEAVHIPHSLLLKMLDSRQAAINKMEATATGFAKRYELRAHEPRFLEVLQSTKPVYPSVE